MGANHGLSTMVKLFTSAILVLCATVFAAAQPSQNRGVRACVTHVLFLGNSYTYFNNLPAIVSEFARAGHQCKVDARMVAPGGARLKDLWQKPEAREALDAEKWDYVGLRDQSTLGGG